MTDSKLIASGGQDAIAPGGRANAITSGGQKAISLVMIVRDEEEVLPRALAGWRLLADELIVVDTGSTDRTAAIAHEHGATVLHYDMPDPINLGAARNVGLDAASGDWIVSLDADEVVADPAGLRSAIASGGQEAIVADGGPVTALAVVWVHHPPADDPSPAAKMLVLKVFRRTLYHWQRRVHEGLVWCGGDPAGDGVSSRPLRDATAPAEHKQIVTDFVFDHRPPPGRQDGKQSRYVDGLRQDVDENPNDLQALLLLASQLGKAGRYDESLAVWRRWLAVSPAEPPPLLGYYECVRCCVMLGDYQEAVVGAVAGVIEDPDSRLWPYLMADICMRQGRWQGALAWIRHAGALPAGSYPHWYWASTAVDRALPELAAVCRAELAAATLERRATLPQRSSQRTKRARQDVRPRRRRR